MRSLLPVRGNLPGPSKIALALLILGAFFLPAPFVMLSPGTPQNILGEAIKISGTQIYPTSGKLSVTSVMVTDPDSYITGFDILYGWIDRSRAILPREEVYPDGETSADAAREGAAEMNSSQINATAAALSYLGIQSPSKLVIVDAVARLVILLLLPALVLLPIKPVNKNRQLAEVVLRVIISE